MSFRTIGIAGACLGLFFSPAFAQQQAEEPSAEAAASEDWAVTVIELGYANAEEVAALLSQLVPPGVRVVPYYQTNSLIISGDRAVIDALTGGDDAANGASDRGEPLAEGELTAQL